MTTTHNGLLPTRGYTKQIVDVVIGKKEKEKWD